MFCPCHHSTADVGEHSHIFTATKALKIDELMTAYSCDAKVGRHYLDDEWGQQLMTLSHFIAAHVEADWSTATGLFLDVLL